MHPTTITQTHNTIHNSDNIESFHGHHGADPKQTDVQLYSDPRHEQTDVQLYTDPKHETDRRAVVHRP